MENSAKVGEALKLMAERLNNLSHEENREPYHICTTCKYRMTETYITQDWGIEQVWHNWCGLNKDYMETKFSQGNGKYFNEPCEYWSNKNIV